MTNYTVTNTTQSSRTFYTGIGGKAPIEIKAGDTLFSVELADGVAKRFLNNTHGIVAKHANGLAAIANAAPEPGAHKPPIVITGMYGIGDNLHQRAMLREWMKTHDVWLQTCHYQLYHDLIEQGLKLVMQPTNLRAQAKTIAREQHLFRFPPPPPSARRGVKIWYHKNEIERFGSIVQCMMGECGFAHVRPDFSMPVKPEWTEKAKKLIAGWNVGDKPIMVFRPLVLRREWNGLPRSPDPQAYDTLFKSIRDKFFVVSIADLAPSAEWIHGPEQDADIKLHHGELDFPTMAALFKEANLVFGNAGFGPVLAQAVGTPSITVYGGRESYRTTQRGGEHLAPSLGIDPDVPCDQHNECKNNCSCKKHITIEPALEKVLIFADRFTKRPTTLIFATTYVDSLHRKRLTELWLDVHQKLNPDCDFMVVDSQSPMAIPRDGFDTYEPGMRSKRMFHNFSDNIGHLSRRGLDGWGRAFSFGLQAAIDGGYEYVVHIEGDSLFRMPVAPIVEEMRRGGINVMSTPVAGTTRVLTGWVETGLMFFSCAFLKRSSFIKAYDWPKRKVTPTPEYVITQLLHQNLKLMPWKARRGDKNQITPDNVIELDWVTHCHSDITVYERFAEHVIGVPLVKHAAQQPAPAAVVAAAPERAPPLKINLGCGTNRLVGWVNHDAEVDITKRLPFDDRSADFILAEHVVEHINYYEAIAFFKECWRVLRPGGHIRIAVPSIEQIWKCDDQSYFNFTAKFHPGGNLRSAMHAILYCHGHRTAWTASLMAPTLFYAGFEEPTQRAPGESDHAELRGVEGHQRVIGERFNKIETLVFEARRAPLPDKVFSDKIAIVVGGAEAVFSEIAQAQALCDEIGIAPTFIVVNDMISAFPRDCIAASLHPDKLTNWLKAREENGYPKPLEVWAHRHGGNPAQTHNTPDWSGSSGLFAVKIMREKGFDRILLAGVPMSVEGGHVIRKMQWGQCKAFLPAWAQYRRQLMPYVRSFSGYTQELFGKPELEFLQV